MKCSLFAGWMFLNTRKTKDGYKFFGNCALVKNPVGRNYLCFGKISGSSTFSRWCTPSRKLTLFVDYYHLPIMYWISPIFDIWYWWNLCMLIVQQKVLLLKESVNLSIYVHSDNNMCGCTSQNFLFVWVIWVDNAVTTRRAAALSHAKPTFLFLNRTIPCSFQQFWMMLLNCTKVIFTVTMLFRTNNEIFSKKYLDYGKLMCSGLTTELGLVVIGLPEKPRLRAETYSYWSSLCRSRKKCSHPKTFCVGTPTKTLSQYLRL